MIIYVPQSDKSPLPNGALLLEFKGHCCLREKQVQEFISTNSNKDISYYCYDTVALDYIPTCYLYYVDNDGNITNFQDKFQNQLKHMYPGEIILNL